jgi:hypothetical protein
MWHLFYFYSSCEIFNFITQCEVGLAIVSVLSFSFLLWDISSRRDCGLSVKNFRRKYASRDTLFSILIIISYFFFFFSSNTMRALPHVFFIQF